MTDPRNTADRIEARKDDPWNEFDANRALAHTPTTPHVEKAEKAEKASNRNGYIRVAMMIVGFGFALHIGTEWPVYLAIGSMVLFQIFNGEGL